MMWIILWAIQKQINWRICRGRSGLGPADTRNAHRWGTHICRRRCCKRPFPKL